MQFVLCRYQIEDETEIDHRLDEEKCILLNILFSNLARTAGELNSTVEGIDR